MGYFISRQLRIYIFTPSSLSKLHTSKQIPIHQTSSTSSDIPTLQQLDLRFLCSADYYIVPDTHSHQASSIAKMSYTSSRVTAPEAKRKSSSDSHSSVSSTTSSASSSSRASLERHYMPKVEIMRCSRCAKSVETISTSTDFGLSRVNTDDPSANGMVRFGHNLYYCERCAKIVGYT